MEAELDHHHPYPEEPAEPPKIVYPISNADQHILDDGGELTSDGSMAVPKPLLGLDECDVLARYGDPKSAVVVVHKSPTGRTVDHSLLLCEAWDGRKTNMTPTHLAIFSYTLVGRLERPDMRTVISGEPFVKLVSPLFTTKSVEARRDPPEAVEKIIDPPKSADVEPKKRVIQRSTRARRA